MRLAPSLLGAAITWRQPNRQNGNRRTAIGFDKREMGRAHARPKQKWGPALLPAPTCTELRICRCSLAWWLAPPALRSWLTSSGVASDGGRTRRCVQPFSTALLGLASFASPARRPKTLNRVRDGKTHSSGASDRLVRSFAPFLSEDIPFASLHRLPAEIGASVPSLPRKGWDFRPDHLMTMRRKPSRAKRILHPLPCG